MATKTRLFVEHRYVVNLFLLVTAASVARTSSLSQTREDGFLRRRQQICHGDPSLLTSECLRTLQNDARPTGSLDALNVGSPEELDVVCGDLVKAKSCVERVGLVCGLPSKDIQVDSEIIFGVAGYLCSKEGRKLLFSEKECLQRDEAGAVLDSCSENDEFNTGDVCSDVQGLRRCIKRGVRKVCNRKAAKFVDKVIYYGLEPFTRHNHKCNISLRIPRSLLQAMARKRREDQNPRSI